MPIREILKQTVAALWDTKLRSFLTMFGIIWGIMSGLLCGIGSCVVLRLVPLPDFIPHPAVSGLAVASSLITLALIPFRPEPTPH